ncbi:PREDICTED: probable serine/threonine-protein kinase drkB, partial [Amphimedon queenslandica]|uniref:Protein kinase domain-containing protein n=2 Tax=Amphimedon queenslandica TaxID=400682 RepID=A0AAN0IRQ4_AMPQE
MDRAQLEPLLLPDLKETGKELGRGAYGVVTEVIVSGTTCAAKKLHDAIVQEDTLRRFGDEVLLHSQQRHPNIVQLIGVYYPPHSQLPMLVMEYLPLSLTQCLERAEELPLQMKYSILLDVAKGLCYLHGKRPPIVHRDLTANNVLLTSSYSAKISDLGVSRLADTFKDLTKAPGNAIVMPPEALKDNPVYDHKLDVFSYGCLILHVLTGQFPEPTNQFVRIPGKEHFMRVPEWKRRSNYIEDIPKENELLSLARDCLNDVPTDRPEMIESYPKVEKALSKYPKMKSRLVVEKELKDAVREKEKMEEKLVQEREEAERNNQEINDENAASKRENEILKNENEHFKADLRAMSSRITRLENALLLMEKEFKDCTEVLKETIRSKDEQLAKQEQDNMKLLEEKEMDLKAKHVKELSETKLDFESKLYEIKKEHKAKMLATTKDYEKQLSVCREECKERVAKVAKEFTSKTSETLESAVISKNELLSSFQSAPLASIPSCKAQVEIVLPYLRFKDEKIDEWCLVDTNWFSKWKKYIGLTLKPDCPASAGKTGPHPGPVNNACLFK